MSMLKFRHLDVQMLELVPVLGGGTHCSRPDRELAQVNTSTPTRFQVPASGTRLAIQRQFLITTFTNRSQPIIKLEF